MLPEQAFAVWNSDQNLISCSKDAWEYLAWFLPGYSDHPYGRALPAEYFGPLPVVD